MDKPFFSLIGPCIRSDRYKETYDSLYSEEIPFEMILVGNEKPIQEMPNNFTYILDGEIIRVYTYQDMQQKTQLAQMRTEVFLLKHAKVNDIKRVVFKCTIRYVRFNILFGWRGSVLIGFIPCRPIMT